jgi:hypothetical protein
MSILYGKYGSLEILDAQGDPLPLLTVPTRPAREKWVQARWGEEFQIRYHNSSTTATHLYPIYVDGIKVSNNYLEPLETGTIYEVKTGTITEGKGSQRSAIVIWW